MNAFRANPEQFDAVIADITMRGLSGIDVANNCALFGRQFRSPSPPA